MLKIALCRTGTVAAVFLISCAAPAGEAYTPVPVSSVKVTPTSGSIAVGQTLSLQASVVDASGAQLAGRAIVWASSNPSVASVSQGGLVAGASPGSATVTASSEGKSGVADIVVTRVPVATISVQPSAFTIDRGATQSLTCIPKDALGTPLTDRTLTFLSENTSVLTVSASGIVTAVAVGSTNVLVSVDSKTVSVPVSVRSPVPVVATVSLSPTQLPLTVGSSAAVTIDVRDAGGSAITDRSPLWSTSAPGIATVNQSGIVTAIAIGTAQVSAVVDGKSGSSTVTVSQVAQTVSIVSVSPSNLQITPGGFGVLTATPLDAQGKTVYGTSVVWSSSASSIATVSQAGLVTAGTTAGSAVITATAGGKSGTAAITVAAASTGSGTAVSQITVRPGGGAYVVGDTGTFVFVPYSSAGTVTSPMPSFSVSTSTDLLTGGATSCSSTGCFQKIGTRNLASGQAPKWATVRVFTAGSNTYGEYTVMVIANVLDSLVLLGGNYRSGTPYVWQDVQVNNSVQMYPYVFHSGGYSQATNAEYSVLQGAADLQRCVDGANGLSVQTLCAQVTPRAAGAITVQARLKKSDGTYWTSTASFTAK